MALFGFGKDKQKESADPSVMAYLEDAMRVKCPAMIIDPRKNEIPCTISSIQESESAIQVQLKANMIADKGAKLTLVIIIDNMRIGGATKLQEVKPGSAVIDIPASFELMERRKKQRAKLNPREGTTAALLTGLFDGIGIKGLVDNMSEVGIRVKVENAIEIKTEKKINITGRTLQTGQIFPIVKLSKIPRCVATIECGGRLIYSEVTSGNAFIGMTFEEMKSEFSKIIDNFVASRSSAPPTSLPPRARRVRESPIDPAPRPTAPKDNEEESLVKADDKKAAKIPPPTAVEPAPKAMAESVSAGNSAPATAFGSANEPSQTITAPTATIQEQTSTEIDSPTAPENLAQTPEVIQELPKRPPPTPLQRIKRKGRTIVLFGTEEATLSQLEALLQEEGYGKISRPESMEELRESAPQGGAGLIMIDLDMPIDNSLAIAASVLAHIPDRAPMVLVTEDVQLDEETIQEANNAGISLILPRPLKIDDALFTKLEDLMGF